MAKEIAIFPNTIKIDNQIFYGIPDALSHFIIDLQRENQQLKQKLNWVAFGNDSELALRYLRKIGYVDFDEDRKMYINKHNNEPFLLKDEKEKSYYIKDEEINEYIQQLEYKNEKLEENIDTAKEKIKQGITFCKNDSQSLYNVCNMAIDREKEILQILEGKGD